MSALGHKQTYAVQQSMSALPPIATAKADFMSASPPKADVRGATAYVCYGPKSRHAHLFDHLVRARLQCRRHAQAERLGSREVDVQLNLCCPLYRQLGGLVALENPAGIDAS